jgi:hypothetical protein
MRPGVSLSLVLVAFALGPNALAQQQSVLPPGIRPQRAFQDLHSVVVA